MPTVRSPKATYSWQRNDTVRRFLKNACLDIVERAKHERRGTRFVIEDKIVNLKACRGRVTSALRRGQVDDDKVPAYEDRAAVWAAVIGYLEQMRVAEVVACAKGAAPPKQKKVA